MLSEALIVDGRCQVIAWIQRRAALERCQSNDGAALRVAAPTPLAKQQSP